MELCQSVSTRIGSACPPCPHVFQVGDWASLWTPEVTAMAVERYAEDFEAFGYSTDPHGTLGPLPGLHGIEQHPPPQPSTEQRE